MQLGVFLDFHKTLNTVNHGIPLCKLNTYGIQGRIHDCQTKCNISK